MGTISREGPSEEKMENTNFSLTLEGDGWPKEEKLAEPTDQHTNEPSKTLVTRVFCKNPGTKLIITFKVICILIVHKFLQAMDPQLLLCYYRL